MKQAYDEGKKVGFTKGKLFIEEEKFSVLSLNSIHIVGRFLKSDSEMMRSFCHFCEAQRLRHPRDVFMSAGIACAALHESEFCAKRA